MNAQEFAASHSGIHEVAGGGGVVSAGGRQVRAGVLPHHWATPAPVGEFAHTAPSELPNDPSSGWSVVSAVLVCVALVVSLLVLSSTLVSRFESSPPALVHERVVVLGSSRRPHVRPRSTSVSTVGVSARPVAQSVPAGVLDLVQMLPSTAEVSVLLNDQAAITVDGPHSGPVSSVPVWLRGWRSSRFETVVVVAAAADAAGAGLVADALSPSGASVVGVADRAPRPWTLPAADEVRVAVSSSGVVVVAQVGRFVVSATTVAASGVASAPVPVAAGFVAKVLRRLPVSAPPRPSGHQPALAPSTSMVELLPVWVRRAPTRGWVSPVEGTSGGCVAYVAGVWSAFGCGVLPPR